MDEAAVAALRDLYSDLEIDGRVLDLGGASRDHFEFAPDALISFAGDAAALPYADGEFDTAISMFGAMFAARPERAASELLRVVRPEGRIAMANWTPTSFIGEMLKTTSRYSAPVAGVPSPSSGSCESPPVPDRLRRGRISCRLIISFNVVGLM